MATKNPTNKAFVATMNKLSAMLDKPIDEITKVEFVNNKDLVPEGKEHLSDWEVRKAGGFTNLKKFHFVKEDNVEIVHGGRLVNNHINKLKKQVGQSLFYEKQLLEAVKQTLKEQPLRIHAAVKVKAKSSTKAKRTIVAAISDTHFGANISKEELHGLNEYSWTIASRRMACYIEQIVNYKLDHRKETDLLIQLNGDIISGLIHNTEWFVDLLTTQFAGTINILTQAISYAALHFTKVKVVCTPGNHGRNMAKVDKGRATTNKWDSFENMIYLSLRAILENHKNVEFVIPEAPFAVYKVQGHNVFQTHGDTVLNVGNPGNSLNMKSISDQVNQISSSELVKADEKIAVVCVGHVHVPTTQILNNGAVAMINGCLSGIDPFAQSIGIFSNNPTQVMYECTEEHAVGDVRMIQVRSADSVKRFDSIIKPFVGKM